MPPAALAFLSYAHNDDYDGQVTRFVDWLRWEISLQLGQDFPVLPVNSSELSQFPPYQVPERISSRSKPVVV